MVTDAQEHDQRMINACSIHAFTGKVPV